MIFIHVYFICLESSIVEVEEFMKVCLEEFENDQVHIYLNYNIHSYTGVTKTIGRMGWIQKLISGVPFQKFIKESGFIKKFI